MSAYIDLTPEQLKIQFDNYDADGSGKIDIAEMKNLFSDKGLTLSDSSMSFLYTSYGDKNDGKIDYYDFAEFITGKEFNQQEGSQQDHVQQQPHFTHHSTQQEPVHQVQSAQLRGVHVQGGSDSHAQSQPHQHPTQQDRQPQPMHQDLAAQTRGVHIPDCYDNQPQQSQPHQPQQPNQPQQAQPHQPQEGEKQATHQNPSVESSVQDFHKGYIDGYKHGYEKGLQIFRDLKANGQDPEKWLAAQRQGQQNNQNFEVRENMPGQHTPKVTTSGQPVDKK